MIGDSLALDNLSAGDRARIASMLDQMAGVGDFSLGGFVGPRINDPALSGLYDSGYFDSAISELLAGNLAAIGQNPEAFKNQVSDYLEPLDISPVTQGGKQIGTINNDLISDALRNLPTFGDYPPIQTGPVNNPQPQQPTPPATERPDEGGLGQQGTVGDGSGQVPDAPTTGGNRNGGFGDILFDILTNGGGIFNPPNGGGDVPTGADNEGSDGFIWDLLGGIFDSGGSNSNSNVITDLLGDIFAGGGSADNALSNALSNIGNTVINAGVSNYAADQMRDANKDALDFYQGIYQGQIDRLEPFRQSGLGALSGLTAEANNNPQQRDLFQGQRDINPETNVTRQYANGGLPALTSGNRSMAAVDPTVNYNRPNVTSTNGLPQLQAGNRAVTLGDSGPVAVNQSSPFNSNDPGLKFLMDEMRDSVQGSAVAQGGLLSGDAAEALQDRAAGLGATYAGQLQNIYSARDNLDLASQNQSFNQTTTNADINNRLNQQDLSNASGIRSQLFGEGVTQFGQGVSLADLDMAAQGQEFSQTQSLNQFRDAQNRADLTDASRVRSQLFNEDLAGSTFDLGQEQANIQNLFGLNAQNFGQNLSANQFYQGADQQAYNQLYDLARMGQNSAAQQAAGGASFGQTGANILSGNGQIGAGNTIGLGQIFGNGLAGLF